MKLFLTFFLMLLASSPSSESLSTFNTSVHNGYAKYEIIEESSNIYYTFKVVRGINNNKMNYGVFLFNDNANSHQLVLQMNSKVYKIPKTDRGDYLVPAIELKENVVIIVLDEKNNERDRISIDNITVEDFNEKTTGINIGLNEGLSAKKITPKVKINMFTFLVYVFAGVILVFGSMIIYMLIAKKGIFNPKMRNNEVFNFREYIQNLPPQETYDNNIIIDSQDIKEVEPTPEETPIVNMYPYQREYDDDDESYVKELLRIKGYSTDYPSLSENEKNLIMLDLMKMRDLKEITREQYQKEIIDLWKK